MSETQGVGQVKADDHFAYCPASSQPLGVASASALLTLLASVPDPRRARGIRHQLSGILAVGIAAVAAGARSFAAIGQWAADADEDLLAALGSNGRSVPSESAIRRTFNPVWTPRS